LWGNRGAMKTLLSNLLRDMRVSQGLQHKDVVTPTGIDQALLSKFENGKRLPSDAQLRALATLYKCDYKLLKTYKLADKISAVLADEDVGYDAYVIAEPRVRYLASIRALDPIVLSTEVTQKIQTLIELREDLKPMSDLEDIRRQKMLEYLNIQYTYESNKIEGNTLTLSETMMVVVEGITISGKSMTEHLEAINHSEAIHLMYDMAARRVEINNYTVMQLHALVLRGIDSRHAGVYRSVPVRISGSTHVPPDPYMIPKLMEDFFHFYDRQSDVTHPVILAAEMHERLVSIHPFIDGNGRTSRLLMNLILARAGYPIAILKGDLASRQRYYKALEDTQVHDDKEAFYHLVIDAVEESMREHIDLMR
jgi:Fic family protein